MLTSIILLFATLFIAIPGYIFVLYKKIRKARDYEGVLLRRLRVILFGVSILTFLFSCLITVGMLAGDEMVAWAFLYLTPVVPAIVLGSIVLFVWEKISESRHVNINQELSAEEQTYKKQSLLLLVVMVVEVLVNVTIFRIIHYWNDPIGLLFEVSEVLFMSKSVWLLIFGVVLYGVFEKKIKYTMLVRDAFMLVAIGYAAFAVYTKVMAWQNYQQYLSDQYEHFAATELNVNVVITPKGTVSYKTFRGNRVVTTASQTRTDVHYEIDGQDFSYVSTNTERDEFIDEFLEKRPYYTREKVDSALSIEVAESEPVPKKYHPSFDLPEDWRTYYSSDFETGIREPSPDCVGICDRTSVLVSGAQFLPKTSEVNFDLGNSAWCPTHDCEEIELDGYVATIRTEELNGNHLTEIVVLREGWMYAFSFYHAPNYDQRIDETLQLFRDSFLFSDAATSNVSGTIAPIKFDRSQTTETE